MSTLQLAITIIGMALVFDFINGFHDAANSIATIVATRVLTPFQAVAWAAFFNFVAAFLFGTAVARTVGKGFVNLELITPYRDSGGAGRSHHLGPDHLVAGPAHQFLARADRADTPGGVALARAGFGGLIVGQWPLTVLFIFLAPMIGLVSAYTLMVAVQWIFRRSSPSKMDRYFRRFQLLSAAAFSLSHGSNDAQKTAGLIAGVLYASHYTSTFTDSVLGADDGPCGYRAGHAERRLAHCAHHGRTADAPQTAQRLLRGDGRRLGRAAGHPSGPAGLDHPCHRRGHRGVGSINRLKAVRWGLATDIVWAWVLTIPAAAIIAYLSFLALHFAIGA